MRSTSPSPNPASSRRSLARFADEALGARAGVDPVCLDPDDPPRPGPDAAAMPQSVTISWVASPVTGVRRRIGPLRPDPDLGAQGALALDDTARDVLREHLDEERLAIDDEVDRLLEELGEARHVHALLVGGEVDRAVDDRRHHRLGVSAADPDRLLHAANARMREREADLGWRRLKVVVEPDDIGHAVTVPALVSAGAARAGGP